MIYNKNIQKKGEKVYEQINKTDFGKVLVFTILVVTLLRLTHIPENGIQIKHIRIGILLII